MRVYTCLELKFLRQPSDQNWQPWIDLFRYFDLLFIIYNQIRYFPCALGWCGVLLSGPGSPGPGGVYLLPWSNPLLSAGHACQRQIRHPAE